MWCVWSLVNKSEVGAGLRKKCASKLVWSVYEFGKQTRSESWFEKSVCKLMCEVCMSLVNKPEVGAGLKKVWVS